ncbi:hypothetical protein [Streptomyces sp. NPDC093109]|uniref:hypothetical protein n=1 Tax=Streptomyces sp. NPDC093109 TaxID=3154977 RepID=UPI003450D401
MCPSTTSEASPGSHPQAPLRLLPWTNDDGKRCYLSPDGPDSRMSRLADDVEEDLLLSAEWLLEDAGPLVGSLAKKPHDADADADADAGTSTGTGVDADADANVGANVGANVDIDAAQLSRMLLSLVNALRVTLRIAESRGGRLEFARVE